MNDEYKYYSLVHMKLHINKSLFLMPMMVMLYFVNMQGVISNNIVFVCNIAFYSAYFVLIHKEKRNCTILFEYMIISMPCSFVAFNGIEYSRLPLSWFNIFFIMLILTSMFKIRGKIFLWLFLVGALGLVICVLGNDVRNAFNQYLNVLLFAFSFIVGEKIFSSPQTSYSMNRYRLLFLFSIVSYSCVLLIQYILINKGIFIGQFDFMGGDRFSIGATFSDYSFSSLYLSLGMAMCLISFKSNRYLSTICLIQLIISSLLVNARTGIMALLIAFVICFISTFSHKKNKIKNFVFGCILILIIILLGYYISESRGQSLFDGSGRLDTYVSGLICFINHPVLGVGFGIQNYKMIVNEAIPHNLIIQYLAQTGFFFTILILLPSINILNNLIKSKFEMALPFFTVAIGGMFIPDLLNSRFIIIVIIMYYIEKKVKERRQI